MKVRKVYHWIHPVEILIKIRSVHLHCCLTIRLTYVYDCFATWRLAVALQTKLSLSNKFSRNLGSMPKTSTHVLSTSRKHTTGVFVKIAGGCCRCTVLKAACYWLSNHCIPVQKCVSMLGELNQNRSSFVFDSDKGVFCHHSSS